MPPTLYGGITLAYTQQTKFDGPVISTNGFTTPDDVTCGSLIATTATIGTLTISAITLDSIKTGDGTAALPSYSFSDDVNTGIYSSASDTVDITTGGTQRFTVSTTAVTSTLPVTAASTTVTGSTVPANGMYLSAANTLAWATNTTLQMSLNASGSLGLGTTSLTGFRVRVGGTLTGATSASGVAAGVTVASDVTSFVRGFDTGISTQTAAFTLSDLAHYRALQGTVGAGSAITTQYGFLVDSSLTGATNNYGFYGNIAAGSNRWNLYMNGTANNYMAGSLGIGSTSLAAINLRVGANITGATTAYGAYNTSAVQSDVTSSAAAFTSGISTAAASFTLSNMRHFWAESGSVGAGSTVSTQVGFEASASLTAATTNIGFRGRIATAADRYNLYMDGTAPNHFSGNVLVFGAGKLGYTTGSGGAVTQGTNRTTAVELNKTNGAITLFSAAGSVLWTSFTVTNSTVAATDTVRVVQKSGTDKYMIFVTAVGAGSFEISFATTGGTTTEQPVFNFAVVGAATA